MVLMSTSTRTHTHTHTHTHARTHARTHTHTHTHRAHTHTHRETHYHHHWPIFSFKRQTDTFGLQGNLAFVYLVARWLVVIESRHVHLVLITNLQLFSCTFSLSVFSILSSCLNISSFYHLIFFLHFVTLKNAKTNGIKKLSFRTLYHHMFLSEEPSKKKKKKKKKGRQPDIYSI